MRALLESVSIRRFPELHDLEFRRGKHIRHAHPKHWHEEFQLCAVDGGGGAFAYRGTTHRTPPGSLFLVPAGEVHSNHSTHEAGCDFLTFYINQAFLDQAALEAVGRPIEFPTTAPVFFDQALVSRFLSLLPELDAAASALERETVLLESFARLVVRASGDGRTFKPVGREHAAVERVREYLTENYSESVSLETLADIAALSPFHLNRVFGREAGVPPHAFQTQVRIAKAKNLLRQGASLVHAALETGFADQSHFTRHFKRIVGVTPGRYLHVSKNVQDAWDAAR